MMEINGRPGAETIRRGRVVTPEGQTVTLLWATARNQDGAAVEVILRQSGNQIRAVRRIATIEGELELESYGYVPDDIDHAEKRKNLLRRYTDLSELAGTMQSSELLSLGELNPK